VTEVAGVALLLVAQAGMLKKTVYKLLYSLFINKNIIII
jgi:hypothetical protein